MSSSEQEVPPAPKAVRTQPVPRKVGRPRKLDLSAADSPKPKKRAQNRVRVVKLKRTRNEHKVWTTLDYAGMLRKLHKREHYDTGAPLQQATLSAELLILASGMLNHTAQRVLSEVVKLHDETARRSTITDRSIFSALMTLYPAALQKETREAYAAAHARATAQT